MPPVAVELENISRLFGRFPALRQITFSICAGRCYLLLGENGAGKSTLLRILAGLLAPTSGEVRLFLGSVQVGGTAARSEDRHKIGYMSHQVMLYDELTAVENLQYFHALYRGMERRTPEEALRAVGLNPELRRPLAKYSQGMRQRAALARVLLPKPRLLLLDEPFSNVDTGSIDQMLALLAKERDEGRTIVLTTHQRAIAAPLADFIVRLEAGRLVAVEEAAAARSTSLATGIPRETAPL